MQYKVFITNSIPSISIEMISRTARIEQWTGDGFLSHQALKEKVKDAHGLLCLLADRIDSEIIESAPNLKVISNYGVGFDNIDISTATQKGIPVGNTPGVLSETTADLAFALLMAAARQITRSDKMVRSRQWNASLKPMMMLGQDIHHSTLGIIGMGRIGKEMARRARGFHMRILYYNRSRQEDIEKELGAEYTSLPQLLKESDFVSLHVPLNEGTRRLIGPAELGLMKSTSILINTARGAVVDQAALYEALAAGKIAGAGLDVFEKEPLPPNDPLLTLDNVVFTPHTGSATVATRSKMAVMAAENLIAGIKGERLPHCVNPEIYRT